MEQDAKYFRPDIEKFHSAPFNLELPFDVMKNIDFLFSYFLTLFETEYPDLHELIVDVEEPYLKARLVTCFVHFRGAMDSVEVLDLVLRKEIEYYNEHKKWTSLCTWHTYRRGKITDLSRIDIQKGCYQKMLDSTVVKADKDSKVELLLFKVKTPDGTDESFDGYILLSLFLTTRKNVDADYYRLLSNVINGMWDIYIDTEEYPVETVNVPGEFFLDLCKLVGSEIAGQFISAPVDTGRPASQA